MTARAQLHANGRGRLLYAWEGAPFGVSLLDAEGHVVCSNEAMRSITGYDAGELARLPVSSYTHPDDVLEGVSSFRRLLVGETDSHRLETRLIRKGGGTVWVDSYLTTMQETPGAPWTALAMVEDITSRKLAELALIDRNARLSRLVETQAEIAGTNLGLLEDVAQLIAERAQELTGADGATVSILDGDDLVVRVETGSSGGAAQVSALLLQGGRNVGSLDVAKGSGVTDDDRHTLELLALILSSALSEATEREARRKQVEALTPFETIFECAPIGIVRVEKDGRAAEANPAMERMLGYTAAELAETGLRQYTHPEDVEYNLAMLEELMAGERDSYQLEKRCYHRDGELVWVQVTAALERDAQGEPKFAISMLENITQRRAAEEQLRQSQKIDAIGQLAAGIAHDFNNLLLGMLGYTELARAKVGADDPVAEYLGRVESCVQSATTLTGQLLAFGRRQTLQPRPLELNALVSETVAMLNSVLGERIVLVTVLDPALDAAQADSGQAQQVLLNLALNARDAMPNGGTLTIRTSNADVGAGEPGHGELEPGRYVVLSVEDEGCGMTPEVRDQIFDPFFTTKAVGKGTGLGLSTAYGIIKQSGGNIEVASEPDHGSAFHCYLPALPGALAEEERAPEPQQVLSQAPQGADHRILVVEDEEIVRTLLAQTLEQLGYTVETASDPSFALPMLRERGDEFTLVISDIIMPHMIGTEFGCKVAESNPELPFVFISGYTEDRGAQPDAATEGLSFLQKPFTSEALATTVREALKHSGRNSGRAARG